MTICVGNRIGIEIDMKKKLRQLFATICGAKAGAQGRVGRHVREMPTRRLSTQRKLMLCLLALLFVFLLANVLLLWGSTQKLEKEVLASVNKQYQNAVDRLDEDCLRIHLQLINFLDDQDLNNLTRLRGPRDPGDRAALITRIQDKLAIMLNGHSLLSNVGVYLPGESLIINANGSIKGSIQRLNLEEAAELDALAATWNQRFEVWNDRLLMPVKSSYSAKNGIYYLIFAEFSRTALLNELSDVLSGIGSVLFVCELGIDGPNIHPAMSEDLERLLQSRNDVNVLPRMSWEGHEYHWSRTVSSGEDITLYAMLPASTLYRDISADKDRAIFFAFLVLLLAVAYIAMDYNLVDRPLQKLLEGFSRVEHNDLNVYLDTQGSNEFSMIFEQFNHMLAHLRSLIDVTQKQKQLLLRAEMKQLQEQTNPHFLYNSYFLLHRMVKSRDYERAVRLSGELGKYLKYVTRRGREFVPFSEEYEHALMYADIQSERFGGRIQVQFAPLPLECSDVITPRLILQPLVENSFLHGLENKEENGLLCVSFAVEKDRFTITVEDNGEELSDSALERLSIRLQQSQHEEITALPNIARRFSLLYGASAWMNVSRSPLGGLRTQLTIPLRRESCS